MSTRQRDPDAPEFGMAHVTVVPTNFRADDDEAAGERSRRRDDPGDAE